MKEQILSIISKDDANINKLHKLTKLPIETIEQIIQELLAEGLIFFNSSRKYETIKDEYLVGTVEKTTKGNCYVIVNGEKIFIEQNDLHTALKNDLVVIERKYDNFGIIKGILERKNNKLVCEVKEHNNKLILVPFNGNCEIQLVTPPELLKDYIIGDRVFITLANEASEENDILVRDIHKIGHFTDKNSDEIAIAISKDFDIDFSNEAMKEAESLPKEVLPEEKKDRLDLTNEVIFTIDSVHTKDMDDAISIKKLDNGNYELGVHIADVAHYVKPGTNLFKEAMKRGTSVYIGDVVIPMIPSILSNGICSLNEGVERLTKSCIMEINPQGKVVNYKITDSVIKSKKKMTYEELNELFSGNQIDPSYIPFIPELQVIRELSNILTKTKHKNGAIEFESSDISIQKDRKQEQITGFKQKNQGEAESIIENFMIMANEVIATDFYWKDLPFIYRTHDMPEEMRLENTIEQIKSLGLGTQLIKIQNAYGPKAIQSILEHYKNTPIYSVISNLLLRSMAKAQYSTENIGHFALSLDNYCHFTSPIRRFPDLMIHTLINKFNNPKTRYSHLERLQDELYGIAKHSSYKERQADDAEKDFIKLRMAQYMEEHKDEEFEGIILDIDKDKVFIKLDNNVKCLLDNGGDFALSFIPDPQQKELTCSYSKQKVKLGTRVKTEVTRVDIPQKQVYVDIKSLVKENNKPHTKKLEKT
jgi:ribonuclease R